MKTDIKYGMAPLVLGCLFGGIAAVAFFIHAASLYFKTPSDPQKAVGYVFIAFYSVFVGASAFSAAAVAALLPRYWTSPAKLWVFVVLAVALAAATVLLVLYSPK